MNLEYVLELSQNIKIPYPAIKQLKGTTPVITVREPALQKKYIQSLLGLGWMLQMAVNHDCTNSALPVEVKKLQQMSEKLFIQLQHKDSELKLGLSDAEFRNRSAKKNNPISMSPDSSGRSQKQPTFDEICDVPVKPSGGNTSVEAQNEVHTFVNPLDYSIHSRQADSTNRSSTHLSPTMKSGSSGISNIGSFSSSSSPSPSLPDSCTGRFAPQRQSVGWKSTRPFGAFISHTRKSTSIASDYMSVPRSAESSNEIRTKRRGRLKKDITDVKVTDSVLTEMGVAQTASTGHYPVVKKIESLKPSVKRHLGGALSGVGNNRIPASTAAYKYLTWREKDRRRRFREEWKHLWLVIPHGRYEVMCLVCHKVMTQRKLDTIKRHTVRRHVELLGMAESERKNLFEQLIRQHSILGSSEAGQTTGLAGLRIGRKMAESTRPNVPKRADYVDSTKAEDPAAHHLSRCRTTEVPPWHPTCLDSTKHIPTGSSDQNPEGSSASTGGRSKDVPENLSHSVTESFSTNKGGALQPHMTPTFFPGCTIYSYSPASSLPSKVHDSICSPTREKVTTSRTNDHIESTFQKVERAASLNQARDAPFPDLSSLFPSPYLHSTQPLNRNNFQPERQIENQPRATPVNITFLQILEQLAASRNRIFSNRTETSSHLAENSLNQSSIPFLSALSSDIPSGYQPFPSVGTRNKHRATSALGSRTPIHVSNPFFKYNKRKCDHDLAAGSQSVVLPNDSIKRCRTGAESVASRKSGQPVEGQDAFALAAVGTSHADLHLSPTISAQSPHHNFSSEANPSAYDSGLPMPAWRQTSVPTLSGENSHRPENVSAMQPGHPGVSSHSSHPFHSLSGMLPISPLPRTPVGTLWSNQHYDHFGVTNDRKRMPSANLDCPYIEHSPISRTQMSNRHENSKYLASSSLPQPWSANLFAYPRTVPMFYNKPPMSEQLKELSGFSDQSQVIQTPQKTSHGTCMDTQPGKQTSEYQAVPLPPSFERANCPVCHWTENTKDGILCEAELKKAGAVSAHHLCPSPVPLDSPGAKDKRKSHQDSTNKSNWKENTERTSDSQDSRSLNRVHNLHLQPCDYFDKTDMRTSFPFWLPSFRPQSTIFSQSSCPVDPTLMLYYSELLRQYVGAASLDGSVTPSVNADLLRRCSTEANTLRTKSDLMVGTDKESQLINVELDKNTGISQPSLKQTVDHETNCVLERHTSSSATSPVRAQRTITPKSNSPTVLRKSTMSSVTEDLSEGISTKNDEIGSPVNSNTKLSPIWSVDICGSIATPYKIMPYVPGTSAVETTSVTDRGTSPLSVHMLRLGPKQDLRECLSYYVVRNHLTGAFVMTCCGSLERARLRLANLQEKEFQGPFEIVSLVGTVADDGQSHLHVAVADAEGHVLGGHLLGQAPVHTTAEIVLGITGIETIPTDEHSAGESMLSCESVTPSSGSTSSKKLRPDGTLQQPKQTSIGVRLMRDFDEATGFKELTFRRSSNDHS